MKRIVTSILVALVLVGFATVTAAVGFEILSVSNAALLGAIIGAAIG